jgi:hypothetical protein
MVLESYFVSSHATTLYKIHFCVALDMEVAFSTCLCSFHGLRHLILVHYIDHGMINCEHCGVKLTQYCDEWQAVLNLQVLHHRVSYFVLTLCFSLML